MKELEDKLIFENDDEFIEFSVCSIPSVHTSNEGNAYYDYDFTPEYTDACNNGKILMIEDPNSKIVKRGAVCRGFITKPVNVKYFVG